MLRPKSPTVDRSNSPTSTSSSAKKLTPAMALITAFDTGDMKAIQSSFSAPVGGRPPNVDMKDEKGRSLLQIAAYKGRIELVRFLVERSAIIPVDILFGCILRGHMTTLVVLLFIPFHSSFPPLLAVSLVVSNICFI
jgi:ankyrin repeat protein